MVVRPISSRFRYKVRRICRCVMGVGESKSSENQTAKGGVPPLSTRAHMYRVIAQNQTPFAQNLEHLWHNGPETPVVTAFPDLSKVDAPVLSACFWRVIAPEKGLIALQNNDFYAPSAHTSCPENSSPSSSPHLLTHAHTYTRSTRRRPSEPQQSLRSLKTFGVRPWKI